jgi:hypothetical protein
LIPQPFRAGLTFGGRPSGPRIRGDCRCHFSLNLPQASQLLGMTKVTVALPHAPGGWWRKQQVPPLRCAGRDDNSYLVGVWVPKNCRTDKEVTTSDRNGIVFTRRIRAASALRGGSPWISVDCRA